MTTNIQRIAASYEIARAVANEAQHPYVTSPTDVEIIDFWLRQTQKRAQRKLRNDRACKQSLTKHKPRKPH